MNEDIAMTPHFQEVNGIRLHYVTWGKFTRPERAVVLVHGLSFSHQEWSEFGPTLAEQGWYAIVPDLRGRGQSDKPPHGYGIPYHVNDLLALCDALSLPRVQLIGHSLGAQIGYFLAAIHPRRLLRLVLGDAGGRVPADARPIIGPSPRPPGPGFPPLQPHLAERQA